MNAVLNLGALLIALVSLARLTRQRRLQHWVSPFTLLHYTGFLFLASASFYTGYLSEALVKGMLGLFMGTHLGLFLFILVEGNLEKKAKTLLRLPIILSLTLPLLKNSQASLAPLFVTLGLVFVVELSSRPIGLVRYKAWLSLFGSLMFASFFGTAIISKVYWLIPTFLVSNRLIHYACVKLITEKRA